MISLQKILVPTDFSDFSQPALNYGCALAARFESELHLLNVIPDPIVYAPEPMLLAVSVAEETLAELQAASTESLSKLPGEDWSDACPVIRVTRQGVPFMEILRYASEQDVDLICLGTHGRTGLKHVLMGSVAERIVRKSPCPVLTVRPEGHQFVMP